MLRFTVCLLAFACACAVVSAGAYGRKPAPVVVELPQQGEASAAALTNVAGAKASAAKIDVSNWRALHHYGHEIGVPLLVKNYGPLTNLYAAALPPRSFVGKIDPAFVKDSYGNVKYISESEIGVAAV